MCSTVSVNAQKFQRLVHSISSLIIPRRRATSGLAELIWALAVRSTSHYRREEAFAVFTSSRANIPNVDPPADASQASHASAAQAQLHDLPSVNG